MYRILCVTPWFPNTPEDGTFNFIYHSVEGLSKAGNQVTTLVTHPWTPRIFSLLHQDWIRPPLQKNLFNHDLNIRVKHYFNFPRNYFHELAPPLYRIGTAATIRRMVREHEIQIIHAHTEHAGFAAVPVAKELGLPVCITLHGINTAPRLLNSSRKRENLRQVLSGADRIILVGEPLRSYFAPLAGKDDHFRVVPNGFTLPDRISSFSEKRWGPGLRIISVSNLHEGKGIDLNIRSLAKLNASGYQDWIYDIVGDGSERASLEAMVAEHGLQSRIKFHGSQAHNNVFDLLQSADIFLLPSYREAFGIAYLEAMASGLLTIGVQGQGPEAFIQNGITGFLVPPRDADAISNILRDILQNKVDRAAIAAAGCEFVRREFTWERHVEKLMAVYHELIREQSH